MHKLLLGAASAAVLLIVPCASAADSAEMAEIKQMIEDLKGDYEARIRALEARVTQAERRAAAAEARAERLAATVGTKTEVAAQPMTTSPVVHSAPAPVAGTVSSGTAFNPQISVILDGNYYQDGVDGQGEALAGQALQPSASGRDHDHEGGDGHAHGGMENGFNFRSAEIAFSATVDPYFDAFAYLAVGGDGNLDLEEGYFQTRNLPKGLRVKGGKFLSDFGYINRQHPHQWDFADQNLAYLNLLGDHGLQDTGLQLTWLPELPVYTLLGVELFQGDQERFGVTLGGDEQEEYGLDSTDDGPRLFTVFAKVGPDLGPEHALQLGVSYAHARQHQELHAHTHHADEGKDHDDDDHDLELHTDGLDGDADLWGLDLVYKYDGRGDYGHRDFRFQAEYLRAIKDLKVKSSAHPEAIGSSRKFTTDGVYAQAIYGVAPKWTAGVRYDVLGLTNEVSGGESADFGSSDRWSLNVTWNPTEFSRLRAQYNRSNILVAENERERFDTFWLQFIMSLGAHGAHSF
jgi:outer membrane receptor protein involved in Fe transport